MQKESGMEGLRNRFNTQCIKLKSIEPTLEFCEVFEDDGKLTCLIDNLGDNFKGIQTKLNDGFRLEQQDDHVNLVFEPRKVLIKRMRLYELMLLISCVSFISFIAFYHEKYMRFVGF